MKNIFKHLFTFKSQNNSNKVGNLNVDHGYWIVREERKLTDQYRDLTELQSRQLGFAVATFSMAFPSILNFMEVPGNHPINLDTYLKTWRETGFSPWLNSDFDHHLQFLAYNFGEFLVNMWNFH